MQQPRWILDGIAAGNRYHFRRKDPLRHNAINLSALSILLAAVGAVIGAGARVHPAIYVPLAGLALGVLFFGLIVLVVHEASHEMFVIARTPGRARRANRLFGWLVSVPFSINYARHWEEGHLIHHRSPLTPDDPQQGA
jgi:fatty acid desaturase